MDDASTCKNCIQWRRDEDSLRQAGWCLDPSLEPGYTGFDSIVLPPGMDLHTGPNFTCPHFEKRTAVGIG